MLNLSSIFLTFFNFFQSGFVEKSNFSDEPKSIIAHERKLVNENFKIFLSLSTFFISRRKTAPSSGKVRL